jgi:hypothetical protein
LWLTLDHAWSDGVNTRTMLSASSMNQTRATRGVDEKRFGDVRSDNDFRFYDLRQDWSWALNDRHLPRFGFSVGRQEGSYDYALLARITDPLVTPVPIEFAYATDRDVRASKLGAYGSWRSRLTKTITTEIGARWDRYTYGQGLGFEVASPRFNYVQTFGAENELRAAWGVVYQPQGVHELQVEDNVTQFFEPERSAQSVIGYTRHFPRGLSLRVDVYDKQYRRLRPRFENLLDPIQLIPEGSTDRIRIDAPEARARGVELTLRRAAERGLAGWISASFARARERERDGWTTRSWEQRETLSFGSSWTGNKWNVSLAGLMHSGVPRTYIGIEAAPGPGGTEIQGVVGKRNAAHMAPYMRLDLRANRDVVLANSRISFYLEVTNLLNRRNECCINNYRVEEGRGGPYLNEEMGYWLPMLPSFGFQWEF